MAPILRLLWLRAPRCQGGLASRKPPRPNVGQHQHNMDQLIPGRSEKPNPHLIPPFFGLHVFSFPGLSGANIEATLASRRSTHQLGTGKRARDGHPEFACARLDRFGHLSGLLLTIRGALSTLSSAAMLSTNRDCSKYMSFALLDYFLFARIEVRIGVRNEELHRAVAIFKDLNRYPSQSLCCDSGKYRTSMVPRSMVLIKRR